MPNRDYDAIRLHLAANLRLLRKRAGLSQEQLGLTADVDRTYLGQIERGEGNPSLMVLCAIAAALGVDVSELLKVHSIE